MMAKFTDIFEDVTKQGTKILTNLYLENGLYPIIDQGQSEIAGYTNEAEGLFTDVPAIIFGDHTRIIKYVDTPCFLGADGVKLLKANPPIFVIPSRISTDWIDFLIEFQGTIDAEDHSVIIPDPIIINLLLCLS